MKELVKRVEISLNKESLNLGIELCCDLSHTTTESFLAYYRYKSIEYDMYIVA
jgi:hypothetical protein